MTPCIEWTGGLFNTGYGWRAARPDAPSNTTRVHRQVWEEYYGKVPDGMVVRHLCHNKRCIRIDHLAVGTQGDNMQDSSRDGRMVHGEKHPSSVLQEDQVREIRQKYASGSHGMGPVPRHGPQDRVSYRTLAREYGVGKGTIKKIIMRTTWRDVT